VVPHLAAAAQRVAGARSAAGAALGAVLQPFGVAGVAGVAEEVAVQVPRPAALGAGAVPGLVALGA
jgi:hypothetical protein